MFDDTPIERFKYYEEYGKLIRRKMEQLYDTFTEEELVHRCKCVLAILQLARPTLAQYYIKAFINDNVDIYTRWAKDKEITQFEYFVLNDKLIVNKNTLTELTYTDCSGTNCTEVITILGDSFKTLLGYENENNVVSDAPLIIR